MFRLVELQKMMQQRLYQSVDSLIPELPLKVAEDKSKKFINLKCVCCPTSQQHDLQEVCLRV